MPELHSRYAAGVVPLDEIAHHHVRVGGFVDSVCHVRLCMGPVCRMDDTAAVVKFPVRSRISFRVALRRIPAGKSGLGCPVDEKLRRSDDDVPFEQPVVRRCPAHGGRKFLLASRRVTAALIPPYQVDVEVIVCPFLVEGRLGGDGHCIHPGAEFDSHAPVRSLEVFPDAAGGCQEQEKIYDLAFTHVSVHIRSYSSVSSGSSVLSMKSTSPHLAMVPL